MMACTITAWAMLRQISRPAPTSLQSAPPYPGLPGMVSMSIRYPELASHTANEACDTEEPHGWSECGLVRDANE